MLQKRNTSAQDCAAPAVSESPLRNHFAPMKRLSSGTGALLANTDRTTLLMQISEQGVAMIDLPAEDLADDVRHGGSK